MATIPLAAKTLVRQVEAKYKSAKAEPVGDDDGYGRKRSVRFDKTSSKWLTKVLPALGLDEPRIDGFEEEDGQVTVHFNGTTVADQAHPFALEDAETVADGGQ